MHSKNLHAVGNALFNKDTSQCMAIAYGWKEEAKYDAEGKLLNPDALVPSDESLANAKLWMTAPILLEFYRLNEKMNDLVFMIEQTSSQQREMQNDLNALRKQIDKALK